MNPRIENPLLLLAAVREKLLTERAKNLPNYDPRIILMVEGEEGQYEIHAPSGNLYYDADLSDGCFANTHRKLSELLPNVVGVVVKWHGRMREFHSIQALSDWAFSA